MASACVAAPEARTAPPAVVTGMRWHIPGCGGAILPVSSAGGQSGNRVYGRCVVVPLLGGPAGTTAGR